MRLDLRVVEKAKKEYWDKYHQQIEDLGFSMISRINLSDSFPVIGMRIQGKSLDDFTDSVKQQIESILPKTYMYWRREIPVRIDYSSLVTFD